MNVLVTGASGLVGRRLVARLLQARHSVTAFVGTPDRDDVLGLTSPAVIDRVAAARDFAIAWTPLDVGLGALAVR